MRLWHQSLIPLLPRQQLLGQHRECCALRGKGWGRKQSTVNYVFKHDKCHLVAYHFLIMEQMRENKYEPDPKWDMLNYEGKILGFVGRDEFFGMRVTVLRSLVELLDLKIYPEHDEKYLQECLDNLKSKGVEIDLNQLKEYSTIII